MIRTKEFLYIRNYEPDRWPAGISRMVTNEGQYGDVDASPTKTYMLEHKEDAGGRKLFELAFGKRPTEELYDCQKDPYQMHNIAADPAYKAVKEKLSTRLTAYLKKTGDPRETGKKVMYDDWPYFGYNEWKVLQDERR